MGTHLRLYGSDKTALGLLPEHTGLTTQIALNAPGTLVCDYPLSGANAELINADIAYIAVVENGVESPDWFLLDDDTDDEASEQGDARPLRLSARGLLALLEHAQVYPSAHSPGQNPNGMDPKHAFDKATPGTILKTLIDRAKARGCFPDLTYTFTATADSAGNAWPKQYDVSYAAGTNYLTLVSAMADNGWIDVRMNGFELEAFVPETVMGGNKTSSVILRLGQQVMEAPRKRSRRGIISHLLGIGADKNMVEVASSATETKYGRREGNASDGRMTTNGSLSSLAQETLNQHLDAKEGFTLKLSLDAPPGEPWPKPGADYTVGDRIAYDRRRFADGSYEALRVRTITWAWGSPTEAPSVSLELNDLFVEAAIRLSRRVTGIVNGSVVDAPPPVDTPVVEDTTTPESPTNFTLDTFLYADELKQWKAGANVTWTAPLRNTDLSDYLDHSQYLVQYRHDLGEWRPAPAVADAATSFDKLPAGYNFQVRVAAMDTNGHVSQWLTSAVVTLPGDTTPPEAPGAFTATTRLGVVTLTWNGKDHAGAAMADDTSHVTVYRSTDAAILGADGVLVDYIRDRNGGTLIIPDLPYNTTQYFSAVAVDYNGNASAPVQVAQATTQPLVKDDVFGEIIGVGNIAPNAVDDVVLADGAVTTPKIPLGAVTLDRLDQPTQTTITDTAASVDTHDGQIAQLQTDLTAVDGKADGKSTVYVQATDPSAGASPVWDADQTGDVWINDGADPRTIQTWTGTAWIEADSRTAETLATVETKVTTFYADVAPSATAVGDLWIDSNDSNRLYRATALGTGGWVAVDDGRIATQAGQISQLSTDLTGLEGKVDGKATVWVQTADPSAGASPAWGADQTGDVWINDGADPRVIKTWTGAAWVEADSRTADVVADVQTKVTTFFGPTAPAATAVGDLWLDSDDGNRLYRATAVGTASWVAVDDARLASQAQEISDLQGSMTGLEGRVDGKSTIYVQSTQPHDTNDPADTGDLWIDTANGRIIKSYNGTDWVVSDDTRLATALSTAKSKIVTFYAAAAPSATTIGDLWIDSDDNRLYRATALGTGGWVEVSDARIDQQAQDIAAINSDLTGLDGRVDGKSTVYVQPTQPHDSNLSEDTGDVWIDTANGRVIKTYNGTDWVVSDDVRVQQALDGLDGKITTFYGASTPSATAVGDLWLDSGNGNRLMRATAVGTAGWVEVADDRIDTQAGQISQLSSDLTGLDGKVDGKSTVYVQNTDPNSPAGTLAAADKGDVWVDDSTGTRIVKVWDGAAWQEADERTAQALSTAQSKITTFYAASTATPSALAVGDLWVVSDLDNRMKRATAKGTGGWVWIDDQRVAAQATEIGTLQSDLSGVEGKVDGKSTVYVQSTAPTGLTTADKGDVWVDTSTADRVSKVWDGDSWESISNADAVAALDGLDRKITTFYAASTSVPSATAIGDLWIITDDSNRIKRASALGTGSWVYVDDARIAAQATEIGTLQDDLAGVDGKVDGKSTVWVQTTDPNDGTWGAAETGDVWVNNGAATRVIKTWTGSAWVEADSRTATALSTAQSKITTFYAASTATPSALAVGDLWIVSDDDNRIKRATAKGTGGWVFVDDARIAAQATQISGLSSDLTGLEGKVDGKSTVWVQSADPSSGASPAWGTAEKGDVWINDGVSPRTIKTWTGAAWVEADSRTADALSTAKSKVTTFYGSATPTALAAGDLWIDSGSNNQLKRASAPGTASWVAVADTRISTQAQQIGQLQTDLTTAEGRIDGKSTVWVQSGDPASGASPAWSTEHKGDVWVNNGADPRVIKTWTGSAWVEADSRTAQVVQDVAGKITTFFGSTVPSAEAIGDLWIDSGNGNVLKRATAVGTGGWVAVDDARIDQQATEIGTLQSDLSAVDGKVDGKSTVYVQSADPKTTSWGAAETGDVWINNGVSPRTIKTWTGSAWIDADSRTADALSTAQSKITTFYAAAAPSALAVGDLWLDSDDGNKLYRATAKGTGGWVEVADDRIATQAGQISSINTELTGMDGRIDGKSTVYVQGTMPHDSNLAADKGDVWIDTADGRKIKTYDGANWIESTDDRVNAAYTEVQTKVTTFYGGTYPNTGAPTAPAGGFTTGDLWVDSNSLVARWDGDSWNSLGIASNAYVDQTTQEAKDSADAAALATGSSSNPIFSSWPAGSTFPTGWATWGTVNPVRETALVRTKPNAVRYNGPDASAQMGMTGTSGTLLKDLPFGTEYVTVEIDFKLVSGGLGGAGLLLDWTGMTGTNRAQVALKDELPNPTLGQWYRVTKVLRRPTTTGTQTSWTTWLMGNYTGLGTNVQKSIVFDRVQYRPSTSEEINAFNMDAAISTAVTDSANGKNKVTYSDAAPSGSGKVAGDTWFQRNLSTGVVSGQWEWDGDSWEPKTLGSSAIAALDVGKLTGGQIDAQHIRIGATSTFDAGYNPRIVGSGTEKTFLNVLNWTQKAASVTGTIVVHTPLTFSAYMCRLVFEGYNYESGKAEINAEVGFYAYTNDTFLQTGQTNRGSAPVTIRLAKDAAGKVVILLDIEGGVWQYPKLTIPRAQVGYTTAPDAWADGWTAEVATDLSPYSVVTSPSKRDLNDTHGLTQKWRKTGTTTIDGGNVAADTVTAVQLAAGAATVEKLTVGSIGDSVVLNGSFEEVSSTDPTLPAMWKRSPNYAGDASNVEFETAAPLSGTKSLNLKVTAPGTENHGAVESMAFPVTPGQIYSLKLTARASVAAAEGESSLYATLWGGATPDANESPMGMGFLAQPAIDTVAQEYGGQLFIPDGWKYARVTINNYAYSTTVPVTITVDQVTCRPVVISAQIGQGEIKAPNIAAEAITADHISANAITADMINTGSLYAEITIAGRLATALTGERVEMNLNGFYAYDNAEAELVAITPYGAKITGRFATGSSTQPRMEVGSWEDSLGLGSTTMTFYTAEPWETLGGEITASASPWDTASVKITTPQLSDPAASISAPVGVLELESGRAQASGTGFRRNMCANPGFEWDLSGWVGNGGATMVRLTGGVKRSGVACGKITANGSTSGGAAYTMTGLKVGVTYTASAYFYNPTTGGTANIRINPEGGAYGNDVTVKEQWGRSVATFTATATTMQLYVDSSTGTFTTGSVYIDNVLIEEGANARPYFDGTDSDDSTYTVRWDGLNDQSTSYAYRDLGRVFLGVNPPDSTQPPGEVTLYARELSMENLSISNEGFNVLYDSAGAVTGYEWTGKTIVRHGSGSSMEFGPTMGIDIYGAGSSIGIGGNLWLKGGTGNVYAQPGSGKAFVVQGTAQTDKLKVGSGTAHGTNYGTVYRSSNQALTTGAWTQLSWNAWGASRYEDDGSTYSSNHWRSQAAGMFAVSSSVTFSTAGTGYRALRIITEGGTVLFREGYDQSTTPFRDQHIATVCDLPGGGYGIRTEAYHNLGSTLYMGPNGADTPSQSRFAQVA